MTTDTWKGDLGLVREINFSDTYEPGSCTPQNKTVGKTATHLQYIRKTMKLPNTCNCKQTPDVGWRLRDKGSGCKVVAGGAHG